MRVDTNLFTYHLNSLVKKGFVEKIADGYTLGANGLAYVDGVSSDDKQNRTQPKTIIMLVVQNGDGDVLLQRRTKQPYIDTWTLPHGKLNSEDVSTKTAAVRIAHTKLETEQQPLEHAGDCYIRVYAGEEPISTTFAHVFRFYRDDINTSDDIIWARPHKLSELNLAPAVEDVMTRTFFKDAFYFEEYDVDWYSNKHESE